MAAKLKKGDKVVVLAGKDKGKKGVGHRGWPEHGYSPYKAISV